MTKRILLISNMYPSADHPTYGVFVKNFARQILTCGFDVTSVVIQGRGRGLFGKLKKYFSFIRHAVMALNSKNYDLIYAHYIGHSLLPFLLAKKATGKPIVINAHGGDVFTTTLLGAIIQRLVTSIIKKADLLVVPSEYFSRVMSEKFSIPENKIFISPSGGVDRKLFKPGDKERDSTLFTLGYVSRIDEGKGWDTLLLAVNRLVRADIKNFRILIVGGGAQVGKLNEMVRNYELNEYVNHVGPIPYHGLPGYYQKMDFFIFPTTLPESLGLVGIEALMCGVPVIGSNIGGLPGYIKPGFNGELFPPGNDEMLAACIANMMAMDCQKFDTYKANALLSAEKYDSSVVSDGMNITLGQVINNASRQ